MIMDEINCWFSFNSSRLRSLNEEIFFIFCAKISQNQRTVREVADSFDYRLIASAVLQAEKSNVVSPAAFLCRLLKSFYSFSNNLLTFYRLNSS